MGAAVLSAAPMTAARAAEPPVRVTVQAGALDRSLMSLATQTKVRILFENALVAGKTAPPVQGVYTARQALEQMLTGSGIEIVEAKPGVLILRPRRVPISTAPLARAVSEGVPAADVSQAPSPAPAAPPAEEPYTVAEIVVGSHIRGVKDTASPVVVLGRDDIDRAGYASVAEALAALPQAFGGVASEDSAQTGGDVNGTNLTRGTGVNLRGLGANATLVLVDGRRMAGSGFNGDFADLSSIPMVATARVEVLLDGASALYGSDAVGGVVNVRLRTDLDGAETRMLAGRATQGGYHQYQFGQAIGRTWAQGHALLAYEYAGHDALAGLDRAYTGNADLRAWGGTDRRRTTYSQPGNILRPNAQGTLVPTYAIPAGQNGVGLRPSDFIAGTVNRENQRAAYWVLPSQARHSLVASLAQDIGQRATLSADARFSRRDFTARGSAPTANIVVNANNPFFVSPTGAASERIAYSFLNELGGGVVKGRSESLAASLGAEIKLPGGWVANAYGAYGQELGESTSSRILNTTFLSEATGQSADSPLTTFSAPRDGYLNPFIGHGSNPRGILDFISAGHDRNKTRSETRSANLAMDGPLFSLPGGALRLALGGQIRREALRTGGDTFTSGYAPVARTTRATHRQVASAYAELNAPLFGPDNARPGLRRLELSLAGRVEHYDDVGSTADPKVGVIWQPAQDLTVKASYGTSFRAPALPELNDPYVITPILLPVNGGQLPSLVFQGGNNSLKPETATSWTTGLELRPSRAPGLRLSATLYQTRFENRIARPVLDNIAVALSSPELVSFRTLVNPASNAADRAAVLALVNDPHALGTGAFGVDTYGAIIEARNVNTGSLLVRGLDLSGSYDTSIAGDPVVFNGALSWLMRYRRAVTPTATATELSGRAGYPADLRARVSATWTHGATSTTVGVNHVGDSADEIGRRIKPWTTMDLQVRLRPTLPGFAWRGLLLALNVQNLFDADPPFYDSPLAIAYDPANADPIGRQISIQLIKAW
ncbi:TonB-dependent receptor [Caulobacter sp. 602-1]|nr:TonB-dependent receptor [Caulobacter sp. 602-1]